MPVSSENSISDPYYPNGVTVSFGFDFKAASASEVIAVDGDGNTISTALYSVTLDEDEGGSLTFGTAPTADAYPVLYVMSDPALTQPSNFDNSGPSFNPAGVTRAFDRAAVRDLRLKREIDRSFRVPFGEGGATLPGALARAGRFFAFDGGGNPYASAGGGADDLLRTDLVADSGTALIRYKFNSFLSNSRLLTDKLDEIISVKDFGAEGDGVTDDTAALATANSTATLFGKSLFFPAGTYMTDPATATTNWYGEAGSIIKNRLLLNDNYVIVTATGIDRIHFDGLTFDGNVSADPSPWNSGNYNTFTGVAGLSVEDCERPLVSNCHAQNMRHHGFRFARCLNATWQNCTATRMRGIFGDGFISISSIGITLSGCSATDYTRIGVVIDSYGGGDVLTGYKITITGCFFWNGHDASIIHGGGEYNAGIWCEHTGDISISGTFVWDNVHNGIVAATGSNNNGFPGSHSQCTITGTHTVGSIYGINVYSLVGKPVICSVVNSSAKLAKIAFVGGANTATDSFTWLGCHADYDASATNGRGFATETGAVTGKPSFFVGPGCTVTRWAENLTYLDDGGGGAATADVGSFFASTTAMRVNVEGLRHVDDKKVYVRVYAGKAHDITLRDLDFSFSGGGTTAGTISIIDCTTRTSSFFGGESLHAEVNGGTVRGQLNIAADNIVFDAVVEITDAAKVWLVSAKTGKYPAFKISGKFTKDINTHGPVLHLGFGSISFGAFIIDAVFYNSGAASAVKPFIEYAHTPEIYFSAVFCDNSVTNISDFDDGGNPITTWTGVTKVAMH